MNDEVQKQTDDNSSDAPDETTTRLTVGQRLRAEREKMEVTWEDVYQDTRIPVVHLEAIENDNFEDLPSEGVLKGFVRNYSKFLKLDPDEFIDQLSESDPRKEELTPVSFGRSMKGDWFFRDMQGRAIIIGLAVFALVILIAAVAIWWFGTNQGERLRNVSQDPNEQVEESESVSSEDVNDDEPIRSEVLSPISPQPNDPVDEPTIGSSTEGATPPSPDSTSSQIDEEVASEDGGELFNNPNSDNQSTIPFTDREFDSPEQVISQDSEESEQLDSMQGEENESEEQSHDLEFTFDDISWVQVTDGTGAVLVNGVQEAETELNLDGEAPFDVRLGKASAVKLLYRGEEVALGQYTRLNDTAVFTLQP